MAVFVSFAVFTEHIFIILTSSLKLSGDVELNPGSYKIIKPV